MWALSRTHFLFTLQSAAWDFLGGFGNLLGESGILGVTLRVLFVIFKAKVQSWGSGKWLSCFTCVSLRPSSSLGLQLLLRLPAFPHPCLFRVGAGVAVAPKAAARLVELSPWTRSGRF